MTSHTSSSGASTSKRKPLRPCSTRSGANPVRLHTGTTLAIIASRSGTRASRGPAIRASRLAVPPSVVAVLNTHWKRYAEGTSQRPP